MLNPVTFAELDRAWGPHTVDRFASFHNCQLTRFNSRCWNPGSEAVDTLTVNWAGEVNWWCPPIPLTPRVIRYAQVCAAKEILIVPCWPLATFWYLICKADREFGSNVLTFRQLPLARNLCLSGLSGNVIFNGEIPDTSLALRCSFAVQM